MSDRINRLFNKMMDEEEAPQRRLEDKSVWLKMYAAAISAGLGPNQAKVAAVAGLRNFNKAFYNDGDKDE